MSGQVFLIPQETSVTAGRPVSFTVLLNNGSAASFTSLQIVTPPGAATLIGDLQQTGAVTSNGPELTFTMAFFTSGAGVTSVNVAVNATWSDGTSAKSTTTVMTVYGPLASSGISAQAPYNNPAQPGQLDFTSNNAAVLLATVL